MNELGKNGKDGARLSPVSGASRDGRPLAYHRAPASDLAPWIARMFVTAVDQPAEQTLRCGLFNDTAFVRLIVRGDWIGEAANGRVEARDGALMFGPHSRRMPIEVTGPFATFGFALRPGALTALGHPWGEVDTDCILRVSGEGPWARWARVDAWADRTPEGWLRWLEADLRDFVARAKAAAPDPLAVAFDRAAFTDPGQQTGVFAQAHRVSKRRVERMARRDFGLSPRQIMRRARVLDMASQLFGFADADEAEEQALRFYDQSHLIRDFRLLLGCTPRQLLQTPHPILALGLEARQARRLELLGKLGEGWAAPWR